MHANGDLERGYPPVLPLASRGALVGATPLLVTGTSGASCGIYRHRIVAEKAITMVPTQSS